MESFRQVLRQLGFIEGQNVAIELRYARGMVCNRLPDLAAELVRMKVGCDHQPSAISHRKSLQQATTTIPIVAISDDIVGAGLVASLSHPDAEHDWP